MSSIQIPDNSFRVGISGMTNGAGLSDGSSMPGFLSSSFTNDVIPAEAGIFLLTSCDIYPYWKSHLYFKFVVYLDKLPNGTLHSRWAASLHRDCFKSTLANTDPKI
jgi:hypothetical protein